MTYLKNAAWIASTCLALSTLGQSPVSAATWYRLVEIPFPPGAVSVHASDISDRGEVVGMVVLPNGTAGFAYLGGSLTLLAAPIDHVVWGASAVNDAGQIVGGTSSEFGIPKSALWASASDPAPLVLESGGGPDANVYTTGINSAGVVSGYYTGSGSGNVSSWRAVKWTPDGDRMRQHVLTTGVSPLPDGVFHAAYGINNAGQVVGTGAWIDPDLPSSQAAIRWEAGEQPVELATLTGVDFFPRMYAYAINENGVSVGELMRNNGVSLAVRWTSGAAVVDLGLAPGFTGSQAVDINDAGVIVGTLSAGGASVAAVHQNGAWVDLNSRLVGAPGWRLRSAVGINAAGQITGQAEFSGQSWAVILTPTAHPLGDMNCDGTVNPFDINGFLLALTDAAAYVQSYANCDINNADTDGDGTVNPFDIQPFIELLSG